VNNDEGQLLRRAQSVEADLRRHKSAIREHRTGAQAAAAELDRIRAECARRGIALTLVPERVPGRVGGSGRA
jgi:hypothetical protein